MNSIRLMKFCVWSEKTPQELINKYNEARNENRLEEWKRDVHNQVMQYYHFLEGKDYKLNYVRSECSGILAFHHQNTTQIEDVTKDFAPPQLPTNEYWFSQDDLRKIYHLSDAKGKCLISLAISYGQGAKEFLALECEKLKQLIDEAKDKNLDFIMWISEARAKTSIQPRSFLTTEAIESVDAYLELLENKFGELPKYLWCNSEPDKHITNEGLNKRLKRLVEKANIKTYDKQVRFHGLRKFTFSRLRRVDHEIAKIICAKKVSASDMTYEEIDERCEKVFRLAYKDISLDGDVTGQTKRKQTETIKQLKEEIENLKKVIVVLANLKTTTTTTPTDATVDTKTFTTYDMLLAQTRQTGQQQ